MSVFYVKLHAKGAEERPSYYARNGEFLSKPGNQGTWTKFEEAAKAAQRARLVDPLGRKVEIEEV